MIPEQEWTRAVEALEACHEVVVACHIDPDGDALGSMLGLGGFLARRGKTVWRSWGSSGVHVASQYGFLPGVDSLVAPEEVPEAPEVFVAVDCADAQRLELLRGHLEAAAKSLNLDHHASSTRFGDINLVDETAASSCEIAYELARRMGGPVDVDEATCFYTGIVTDTGRFQHASTSPATLRTAAELREIGVDHERVAREVYAPASLDYLHVLGVVLERSRLADGLVWSWLDLKDLGELDLEQTEHFIDALRGVKGSTFAVLLKQVPEGGFKASLRSQGEVDVATIARAFGGGGHTRAAGFKFEGAPQQAVEAIQAVLQGSRDRSEAPDRHRPGAAGDRSEAPDRHRPGAAGDRSEAPDRHRPGAAGDR